MFGGGGGGLNPRKMQQMMDQMGIDMDELDAEEVVIRTADEELYFDDVEVTCMSAQGQDTYQVVGEPERRERGEDGAAGAVEAGSASDADATGVTDDDVELVSMRAGVDEETARQALEDNDGDLAAAIDSLE
jgi:nascent polypeptide-associated complex subunit alpha